jgi:ABC-type transport system involved in multi-copper enzyme maturation permease subunit
VVVVAVFILVLLFAGWFLDPNSVNPAQLYISFVMTATSYLVLLLTLILCTLSLPADLKNRTLHTIVTKPVRASELILGRIFGFAVIGTVLLLVMATVSYFFVVRGLAHTHTLELDKFHAAEGSDSEHPALTVKTNTAQGHIHAVKIEPDGTPVVEPNHGHSHAVTAERSGDKVTQCTIGPVEGELIARVPINGSLAFLDRTGQPAKRGISVGKENPYRSYIEGGTPQAAIWTFKDVSEDRFPEGLPIALKIVVFRSWKGIMDKGILGSLSLWNPQTNGWVEAKVFTAKHDTIDVQMIDRQWQTPDGKTIDIFKDLVKDGELRIRLRCEDPAQYYGVAERDVYLCTPDASFVLNFYKGYLGIWLQMILLTALGVFFSTFLSGPVAMLSTAGMLVGGLFHNFLFQLATGQTYGGGPFESIVRLFTQDNVISELEPGLRTTVVQSLDRVFQPVLYTISTLLPDFGQFDFSDFVANGFNVPGEMVVKFLFRAAAFVVPVFVASYICFKMREVAK